MFASDRDLLVLEPNLFRDVPWVGQRVLLATGTAAGTTMTITGGDFLASGVAPGNVLMYDAVPLEVTAVTSATVATVSLLRAGTDGALIPPPALGARPVASATFAPQIAAVHRQLLRMLGIEPDLPAAPGLLTEASITTPGALAMVESVAALHLIYSAASALSGPDSALGARAEFYRRRFVSERQLAAARIDTDGDGVADATRRLNIIQLVRAW
jgi:hypothetical protein